MKKANSKAHYQSNQEEEADRHRAIDLYIQGKKPQEIAREVGRSRSWFYKTLSRYEIDGREGLESRSRAPQRVHNRTLPEIEAAIIRVRQTILSGEDPGLRYASVGADTIALELKRAGLQPPSRRTINRVLRRHQLITPRIPVSVPKLPVDYPWPCADVVNAIHLFDFVTRSLPGGGRFYSCNLLDQKRHWPFLRIIVNKRVDDVQAFLVAAWQELGLPTALYIDNDAVWRGSSSAPRTFSRIVRLVLLFGVQVIFTPPYTPPANPIIESFNSLWAKNFWNRRRFDSLQQVQTELSLFEYTMRHRHPCSDLGGVPPAQINWASQPFPLAADFTTYKQRHLPLTQGFIHFIRFVELDGSFSILNESWCLGDTRWAGKTIRATIDLAQHQLLVFHQADRRSAPRLIAQFPYEISEPTLPLNPCFQRNQAQLWLPST